MYYALDISAACTLDGRSVTPTNKAKEDEFYEELALLRTAEEDVLLKDAIMDFLLKHPGVYLRILLPGARGSSSTLAQFESDQPVFCRDKSGQCVRAAIVNAIHAISGEELARDMLRKGDVVCMTLKHAQPWMQQHAPMFHLQKEDPPFALDRDGWFRGIMSSDSVYVVRLIGKDGKDGTVDHCEAIDAKCGLVIDCCEENALHARDGVLEHCVGDGFNLVEVEEIRRMVQQEKRKGKKKWKKDPHSRKREREDRRKKRDEENGAQEKNKRCIKQ